MKIEKGVPLPSGGHRAGLLPKAMRSMEIGDCLFVSVSEAAVTAVRQSAHRIFGAGGYSIRNVDGGYRIWRIQ